MPLLTTDATGTASTPTGHTALGFPGQTRTIADLWYNRYRDYDPTTGRYIQADPIGLEGGSNAYAYASGNPLKFIDPDGLNPAAVRAAVTAGELMGEGMWILCQRNPKACMATIGGAAVSVSNAVNSASGNIRKWTKASDYTCEDDDDPCQAGWWHEYETYCYNTFGKLRGALRRCRDRANDRLHACKHSGGRWPPNGPDRWSWQDENRFRP